MKKQCLLVVLPAFLLGVNAMAASDSIMSNRENECAIWLCLPGGFVSGCENAYSAYIKRITSFTSKGARNYTDLPRFDLCVDPNPEGIEDYNIGEDSEITYNSGYEVYMPAYNTCTRWKKSKTKESKTCAAVQTTPARTFISDEKYHEYQTIEVGQEEYTTHYAPTRHYAEVLVDGAAVGERWYDDD